MRFMTKRSFRSKATRWDSTSTRSAIPRRFASLRGEPDGAISEQAVRPESKVGILTNERNAERPDALFAFTNGVDADRRLARQEIRVQKAWAQALVPSGILTADEAVRVSRTLDEALMSIEAGRFIWR